MRESRQKRAAFSLVELSTLIAIIAVVAAMAQPRYANSLALYRAQSASQRVAADINLIRSWAKISSAGQSVVFNTATNSYSCSGMAGLPGQASPYTVVLTSDPYLATLVSASFGSTATLSYDQYGRPSSGGTVSIQFGSNVKTIVVDGNTGLATVE